MVRLLDFLFPPRTDEAVVRAVTHDAFLELLTPRPVVLAGTEITTLLPFSNPSVRSAIHEAKYHGSEKAFGFLAAALGEYLREYDRLGGALLLVPIPLGQTRMRERGFNQTEEVVKRAAKELALEMDSAILERVRETRSQTELSREERRENMRGAFSATHPIDPSRSYILIDDVATTGATLLAAHEALVTAGAKDIQLLALAH